MSQLQDKDQLNERIVVAVGSQTEIKILGVSC